MIEFSTETSQSLVNIHGEKATMTFSWLNRFDVAQHSEAHGAAERVIRSAAYQIFCNLLKKEKEKKKILSQRELKLPFGVGLLEQLESCMFQSSCNRKIKKALPHFFFYSACNFIVHVKKQETGWWKWDAQMVQDHLLSTTECFNTLNAAFRGCRLFCIIVVFATDHFIST